MDIDKSRILIEVSCDSGGRYVYVKNDSTGENIGQFRIGTAVPKIVIGVTKDKVTINCEAVKDE